MFVFHCCVYGKKNRECMMITYTCNTDKTSIVAKVSFL